MTDNSKAALIEKIRRLMALATSSNEYEAAAAAQKAQELLFKHNLEMADVNAASRDEDNDVTAMVYAERDKVAWRAQLLHRIALATNCQVVRSGEVNGMLYTVIGQPANIAVSVYLYEYTSGELVRLAPRKAMNDWCLGAAEMIGKRLAEQLDEFKQVNADTRALVVTTQALVRAKVAELFPHLSSFRVNAKNRDAYAAGAETGRNLPLNRAVGQTNAAGQRLLG